MGKIFFYVINGKELKSLNELDNRLESLLIKDMINSDSNLRPSADDVLMHPILWNSSEKLEFFQDISDFITENKVIKNLRGSIEKNAYEVFYKNWMKKLNKKLAEHLASIKQVRYDGSKVSSLLRAIRNTVSKKLKHSN